MDESAQLSQDKPSWRYRLISLLLRPVFAAANLLARMALNQADDIEVSRVEVHLPRLAAPFDGYRVVHLSDIHMGTWITETRLRRIVEMANELQPDLVLITGDFVTDADPISLQGLRRVLPDLRPRDGVVGVLGNHDHWAGAAAVRDVLQRCGILELRNDVFLLRRGDAVLHLAGVEGVYEGRDRLDRVLEKLPGDAGAILLCHEPDFADVSSHTGRFDLQLSGHSHGGQLVFPLIGAPVLPRFARKYPHGLYRINGMVQYTSRGVGTSRLKLRFNARPEIAVLTLRSGQLARTESR